MATIRISDFAVSPGGRYIADGAFSGEWFRNEILAPAWQEAVDVSSPLTVELDGTSGYGSSFREEAFGGLIRKRMFSPRQVETFLKLVARSPLYAPYQGLAEKYIASAKADTVAA
jgi:STAS-like domain of unknown function (DUF4325)